MNAADRRMSNGPVSIGVSRSSVASSDVQPDTITTASAARATTRRTRVTAAVRLRPPRFTTVIPRIARTATSCCWSGQRYAPTVNAIAEHDAVLPTTKPHPARWPHPAPRRFRPNTYVPPDSGYSAASWADDVALQNAIAPAITRPISSPVPAASAAGPQTANTPAPTIEPAPTTTASASPRRRCSPAVECVAAVSRVGCGGLAMWPSWHPGRLDARLSARGAAAITVCPHMSRVLYPG